MPVRPHAFILAAAAAASLASAALAVTPTLVRDINPAGDSFAGNFVTLNGVAYFRADDGVHGTELWRSDGTAAGTQQVVDLQPGSANGFPTSLTPVGDSLYFSGFDAEGFVGSKVFKSDGTAAGTVLVADVAPGTPAGGFFGPPAPGGFTPLGDGTILFTAFSPATGTELYKTDGTPAGTGLVKDIHPGATDSFPVGLTAFNGVAYFGADDSLRDNGDGTVTFDRELFRSDGTAAGTGRVKDINPGPEPSIPTDFIAFNNAVYFRAFSPATGTELWKTDGTGAGTTLVADLNPGSGSSNLQDPIVFNNKLLFLAGDDAHGVELFSSDGTAAGSGLVKDINPTGDSFPFELTPFAGKVYFSADDGVNGGELWVTDGTAGGTSLFADLNPGPHLSGPMSFTVVGDKLFFVSIVNDDTDFTTKSRLWMIDAATGDLELVYEEAGKSFGYAFNNLTALGDTLLFTAPAGVDADGFSTNVELFSISVPEPGVMGLALLAFPLLRRRRA